jgi:hypothetical protein
LITGPLPVPFPKFIQAQFMMSVGYGKVWRCNKKQSTRIG